MTNQFIPLLSMVCRPPSFARTSLRPLINRKLINISAHNWPHERQPGVDSAFLKEKVANINEEIRSREVGDGRKRQHLAGGIMPSSDEPGGETDTSFSVSEGEEANVRHGMFFSFVLFSFSSFVFCFVSTSRVHKINKITDDQSDLVTNQLMNLSDLLVCLFDLFLPLFFVHFLSFLFLSLLYFFLNHYPDNQKRRDPVKPYHFWRKLDTQQ